jgi:hypothetical protein
MTDPGQKAYGLMPFNPSSIVNTAPHFGHLRLDSVAAYCPQPKENIATNNRVENTLTRFFMPSRLLFIFLASLHQ